MRSTVIDSSTALRHGDQRLSGSASLRVDRIWPLALLFLGIPIWWLLGVWQAMFFVVTVPMALVLVSRRRVLVPRVFWIWLLWLVWLLTGLFVLHVDAPGAVPGWSPTRYLTFGYRFGWYVAATVVAVYLLNLRGPDVAARASRLIAWFFVMLVGGGLLGILVPTLSFPSALELVLPKGLARHPFVFDLIHVQVAQIQGFLGHDEARPSAPFAYTNEWALAVACTAPFFLASWWSRSWRWRVAATLVLIAASFVIVSSLNRGLWLAIIAMAAFYVVHSLALGRFRRVVLAGSAAAVIGLGAALSPMGDLVQTRLNTPHSDTGRMNLGSASVASTLEGSPIVGFGSTRDVAGNFVSIAAGASADCPHCQPPPLGTHGQLWLVTFGAGIIGALLFVGFLLSQVLLNLRVRSSYAVAGLCSLVALIMTLPVYNSVGVSLFIGFMAIGLISREDLTGLREVESITGPVARYLRVIALAALIGVGGGLAVHAVRGDTAIATQRLLVPVVDMVGVPGARPFTLDTEAGLATSDPVVQAVMRNLDVSETAVRESLRIGAEPNTRVMLVTYSADSPQRAELAVEAAVSAYLEERDALVRAAEVSVSERYLKRRADLERIYSQVRQSGDSQPALAPAWGDTGTQLIQESNDVSDVLLGRDDSGVARPISGIRVATSSDALAVRVSSGLGLGLLAAVPVVFALNRRRAMSRRGEPSEWFRLSGPNTKGFR